uniref:GlxA family transcriptional regulator n=1 Tax=Streptomyces chartreusis TaxID=1969 RepID=UPI003F494A56
MPISVALLFTSPSSSLDISAAREIFGVNRTYLADPWYDFAACASDSSESCDACRIERLYSVEELPQAHTVIIPGGLDIHQAPPAALVKAVRDAHDAGTRLVAVSTGAFVLGAAGLLDGLRITTHWIHADALAAQYPRVTVDLDALYVEDGGILTSPGGAASLELFLHMVRLDHGAAVAKALAHRLGMAPQDAAATVQLPQVSDPGGADQVLPEVLSWVTQRLDTPVTVDDMAQQANVSRRTLTRHFRASTGMAPLQWLLAQRVQLAQRLLETTQLSIEQIATQTGMGTAATLRRHFGRTVGVPPDSYRRWFRARGTGKSLGLTVAPAAATS